MTALALRSSASLRHTIDLVLHLVVREVHLRYRRSVLGLLWAVAQPLARFFVLAFVFTAVLPLDVHNYPLFLFSGLIGWTWFASGVSSATTSAIDRRDLLLRPGLSRMLPPVVSVLTDATDYVVALPVLAVILTFAGGVPLTWLLLPVALLPMFMVILGLGFALCAANVYLRDVHNLVGVAILLGFYITPVFFTPELVPDRFQWVVDVNPVAALIEVQRDVLVAGQFPQLSTLTFCYAAGAVCLAVGGAIYRRVSPTFVDEL